MKVCISASTNDLNAPIDPRFGRAQGFLLVDTETMAYEFVDNQAIMASGGAGTQAAQLISDKGARAVLTGNVGPNAFNALTAAGIPIYVGLNCSAREAVEKFRQGLLQPVSSPSVGAHAGMGGKS
jgi:predicted Fe-Mo cluster-binding NifX family protein